MNISSTESYFGLPPLKLNLPKELRLEGKNQAGLKLDPRLVMQPAEDPLLLQKVEEDGQEVQKINYQQTYLASTQNYYENTLEGGYLPVFSPDLQLLIRCFQVNNAYPPGTGDFLSPVAGAYTQGLGAQFKLNLMNQDSIYGRAEISEKGTAEEDFVNATVEALYVKPAEKLILRSVFSVLDDKQKIMNQVYSRFPILEYDKLNFRVGIEQLTTISEGTNLTLLGKIDGVVRPDPWWGWNFQFFVPVPTKTEQVKEYPGVGVFFWTGFVHSKNAFSEIMLYLNTRNIEFKYQDQQDLIAGIILKTKFGTEARWWP